MNFGDGVVKDFVLTGLISHDFVGLLPVFEGQSIQFSVFPKSQYHLESFVEIQRSWHAKRDRDLAFSEALRARVNLL